MQYEDFEDHEYIELPENYFVNIHNSVRYDYRLIMASKIEGLSPIEKFVETNYYSLPLTAPTKYIRLRKEALNNIICNLVVAAGNGKIVAIARRRGDYTKPEMYGIEYYTYSFIVDGVNALRSMGYIEQWNGYYDRGKKKGKRTRIWATEKLLKELRGFSVIIASVNTGWDEDEYDDVTTLTSNDFERVQYTTPIILKDDKKKMIEYRETKKILAAKNFLQKYNEFVESNSVTIPSSSLSSPSSLSSQHIPTPSPPEYLQQDSIGTREQGYAVSSTLPLLGIVDSKCLYIIKIDCRLYRVFNNGNFTEGGRFYGATYQCLSEEQRKAIQINGNSTVEIDFRAFHVMMLYHLEKIDFQGDPYSAVSKVKYLRDPIKKLMQMMINAKTPRKAIEAFNKYLYENPAVRNDLYPDGLDGIELMKMIQHTHKPIEKYFNSGKGVELQYIDSQIAESILKHFMNKDVVCLCIHDSFIVEEQYKDELIERMKEEYKKELGFIPQLKISK